MSLHTLRDNLAKVLDLDLAALRKANQYYRGQQPLTYLAPELRDIAKGRLANVCVNWPRLVVDAVEERLDVQGFRTPAATSGDPALWAMWQANNLDARSQQAHLDALIYGRSFVSVWIAPDGRSPRISVESPLQTIVDFDPASGEVTAALKRWRDTDGHGRALLWTNDQVATFRTQQPHPTTVAMQPVDAMSMDNTGDGWQIVSLDPNPLGVVPVVPFVNRPQTLLPLGDSELADVMPLADAVNKLATDMMTSAEFHAMPRRWATGLVPAGGGRQQTVEVAEQAAAYLEAARKSKLWIAGSAEAKFGQFPEATLDGFVTAIRLLTTQVAAVAGLPPHYLGLVSDNAASADAIRSAEASLVKKAYRRQRLWGESWEQVMRLAVAVRDGLAPADLDGLETIWRSPETRTVAQSADAATKLYAAGILDRRAALEEIDASPETIARIEANALPVVL